jgi:hypothetical protein
VTSGRGRDLNAPKHARDFFDPRVLIERIDRGQGPATGSSFNHLKVSMRSRCHLRKVGDAEHLTHLAEATHEPTDQLRDCATDATIGLIENQGSNRLGTGGRNRDGQTHSGQFAARPDFGQRPGRTGAMPGNLKFDTFGPGRAGVR